MIKILGEPKAIVIRKARFTCPECKNRLEAEEDDLDFFGYTDIDIHAMQYQVDCPCCGHCIQIRENEIEWKETRVKPTWVPSKVCECSKKY